MQRKGMMSRRQILALTAGALAVVATWSISTGAVAMAPGEIVQLLWRGIWGGGGTGWTPTHYDILWRLRLPRVLSAMIIGASLAVAGAVFQGLFRNPLADPYLIGVSSGAAVGAVAVMILAAVVGIVTTAWLTPVAFAAAAAAMVGVYVMAREGGRVPVANLLLAGVAVSALGSSVVSLLVFFYRDQLEPVYFWLLGGLSGATWDQVALLTPYFAVGMLIVTPLAWPLNAMLLGEETAHHLGIPVETLKRVLLGTGALLTAGAVATSGMIGFIGLIVPHIVRMLVGPDHRTLVPASALLGAAFLVAADTLARTIIAPQELPVGVVTALVGGPFFIYLLQRRHHRSGAQRGGQEPW